MSIPPKNKVDDEIAAGQPNLTKDRGKVQAIPKGRAPKKVSLKKRLVYQIPPLDEDVVVYFLQKQIRPINKVGINAMVDFSSRDQMELYALISKLDSFWLWEAHKKYPEKFSEHFWAMYEVEKLVKYMAGDGE